MKSGCISHPEREPMIVIRKSQVEFCNGNTCAAALMSFFEYWHNIKLDMSPKNAAMNKIAEFHGDNGGHDESLLQFHSMTELSDGIMGLYGINSIKSARKLLVEAGVITEHKNPSDRYKFDHTIYYLFHPEIYSEWLNNRFVKNNESSAKNNDSTAKNNDSTAKINGTITEITTEITTETKKKEISAIAQNKNSVQQKPEKFTKPTIEDVVTYCLEKTLSMNPDEFFNYYESNGWFVGKVPMKSWKAACSGWAEREKKFNRPKTYQVKGKSEQREQSTASALMDWMLPEVTQEQYKLLS